MKTARLFLIGMYLHLALSIAAPVGILVLDWRNSVPSFWSKVLGLCYFAGAVLALLLGWLCVIMGLVASHQRHMGRLVTGWRMLKLKSIPFHILNFLWSGAVLALFIMASRGPLYLLAAVPMAIACVFVFQSGCLGIALVHTMRRHGDGPTFLHYLGQILPVADVVSTLFLLRTLHVDNIN